MFRNYYELAKPGIVYGNIIAAAAGFLLASNNGFDFLLFIFAMSGIALVMASACVINNFTDRRIDGLMSRTASRALVTGVVTPRAALLYAVVLGIAGFSILTVYTNSLTVLIGAIGFIDYVALYAISKRKSVYGTLVGTISGATPPVAGYIAVTGTFDTGALLLFIVMVFWQMAHFYAIAIFRAKDYKAARIPVLPVSSSVAATKKQIYVYIVLFIIVAFTMPFMGYGSRIVSFGVLGIGIYWLYVAVVAGNKNKSSLWAKRVFKISLMALLAFCAMLAAGPLLN